MKSETDAKKRVVILLNGEPYRGEIPDKNAYVLCCDGAYSWAKGKVKIDENLGDFDSLDEIPVPAPLKKFPSEKDETDGELAVDRALRLGATELLFYGGGGRREDHFLGNLHLLHKAKEGGSTAVLVTNGATITLVGEGECRFSCGKKIVSLLPFGGEAHIMSMRGLKYTPADLRLYYGSTHGISNVAVEEEISFRVEQGEVLVIINEEEV